MRTIVDGPRTPASSRVGLALALSLALATSAVAREPAVPAWDAAQRLVTWWHAAEVPDSEMLMLDLVMNQRLVAWSREWIGAAVAAAPSLDEALAEAGRRGRLLLWYVPAVEGQHVILPHLLDRYMMLGPFADPEVAALLERRYLPIKLPAGGELARRFALVEPEAMQPALLVLAPDGEELLRVDRIATFQPEWFTALLSDVARTHGDLWTPDARALELERRHDERTDDVDAALDLAEERLLAGEVDGARALLETVDGASARGTALRARLALRERRGGDALALARLAEARADDADGRAASVVLAARALLGMGRNAEALDALAALGVVADDDGGDDALDATGGTSGVRAEAGYLAGVAAYLVGRDGLAVRTWRRCADEHPGTLWGARAAACGLPGSDGLLGETALVRGMTQVAWMADEAYRARETQWRRTSDAWPDVARRALGVLLEQQRFDGSWNGSRWGGGDEPPPDDDATSDADAADDAPRAPIVPHPDDDPLVPQPAGTFGNVRTATAALACLALRAWRELDPARVDAALARGEAFLLRDDLVGRDDADMGWVYADAFRVLWYARRHAELPDARREAVRAAAQGWVDALVAQQDALDGSFRHYAAYKGTFVTACVAWCLLEGRDAGLDVADAVFERASDVLESARGPEGLFGYLVDFPQVGRSLAGAANRQPLCEWVLQRCGRREPIHVRAGLELFLETLGSSAEKARKGNFHVPELDQTAGYFFFHNFVPAALAARALGADGRAPRERLLRELCALPEIDGSFLDAGFSYGKGYSTAMALLALDALVERGEG